MPARNPKRLEWMYQAYYAREFIISKWNAQVVGARNVQCWVRKKLGRIMMHESDTAQSVEPLYHGICK